MTNKYSNTVHIVVNLYLSVPMTQVRAIIFTTRLSFNVVCDISGWQIAMYLSMVKPTITSIEQLVQISMITK